MKLLLTIILGLMFNNDLEETSLFCCCPILEKWDNGVCIDDLQRIVSENHVILQHTTCGKNKVFLSFSVVFLWAVKVPNYFSNISVDSEVSPK